MTGTIRAREAKTVISDKLAELKVSPAIYKINGRKLSILVGARVVEFSLPSGLSYYGLGDLLRKVEVAIREAEQAKRHRQQIDIEEAIAAAPCPATLSPWP